MPLIRDDDLTRLIPPHEPDAWFDVRPIRAGDFEGLQTDGHNVTINIDLLCTLVKAWAYDAPINHQTLASLDIDTFVWLDKSIQGLSGIRGDDEKKDSAPASSPPATPRPKRPLASSRQNSHT